MTNTGRLLCGNGACESWATGHREYIAMTSARWTRGATAPARRGGRTCDHCHKPLPRLRADQFPVGRLTYCTLTCVQSARSRTRTR